jgi:hypothetical protein
MGEKKIAVIFHGQLSRGHPEENIKKLRKLLPNADFFCTTWKGQPASSYVTKYFDEPRSHYNAAYPMIKNHIALYRKLKKNNFNPKTMKAAGYDPEWGKHFIESIITDRHRYRNQNKQHLLYALSYKEFVKNKGYDIGIRARYDMVPMPELAEVLPMMIDRAYEERRPVGNHWFPRTLREHIDRENLAGEEFPHGGSRYSPCIRDWLIIHRADMFDPDLILTLHHNKQLSYAEEAWWQMFCEPFRTTHLQYQGYVSLEAQMLNIELMRLQKAELMKSSGIDEMIAGGSTIKATSSNLPQVIGSDYKVDTKPAIFSPGQTQYR